MPRSDQIIEIWPKSLKCYPNLPKSYQIFDIFTEICRNQLKLSWPFITKPVKRKLKGENGEQIKNAIDTNNAFSKGPVFFKSGYPVGVFFGKWWKFFIPLKFSTDIFAPLKFSMEIFEPLNLFFVPLLAPKKFAPFIFT